MNLVYLKMEIKLKLGVGGGQMKSLFCVMSGGGILK